MLSVSHESFRLRKACKSIADRTWEWKWYKLFNFNSLEATTAEIPCYCYTLEV